MDFRGVMTIVFEITLFFDSPCIYLAYLSAIFSTSAGTWTSSMLKPGSMVSPSLLLQVLTSPGGNTEQFSQLL